MVTMATIKSDIAEFAKTEHGAKAMQEIKDTMSFCDGYTVAWFEDMNESITHELMDSSEVEVTYENGTHNLLRLIGAVYNVDGTAYIVLSQHEYWDFMIYAGAFGLGTYTPEAREIPEVAKEFVEMRTGGTR